MSTATTTIALPTPANHWALAPSPSVLADSSKQQHDHHHHGGHHHRHHGHGGSCCAPCRSAAAGTTAGAEETLVVRLNPACPVAQRLVVGAALANVPIVLRERDVDDLRVPSVCFRGRCVDGADVGLMYIVRHAASAAALAAIFDDDGPADGDEAAIPLLPSTDAEGLRHAKAMLEMANTLAVLQLRAAAAAPSEAKAAKNAAHAQFAAVEAAVRAFQESKKQHGNAGPFLLGAGPCYADAALVPLVARQMTLTMGACVDGAPRLWAAYAAACATEAVAESIEEHGFDADAFETYAEAAVAEGAF